MSERKLHFETLQIHGGYHVDESQARGIAIHPTAAYHFPSCDYAANLFTLSEPGYIYTRLHNPTTASYEERLAAGEKQKQLSKEFVREWLMENGFQGQEGQQVPDMTPEVVAGITERYIELFEAVTGEKFVRAEDGDIEARIERNVSEYLKTL